MEPRKRQHGLDGIKLLGMYLVILYHVVFPHMPDVVDAPTAVGYLRYFLETFLGCCVPLFFMASGALALKKPVDLKKNTRRCLHLLVITVIWVFLSLGGMLLIRREWYGWSEFFSIAWELRIGYIQHLWFLPCFLFICLFTPVMGALKFQSPKIYRYLMILMAVLTFGNVLLNDGEYLIRWGLGLLDGRSRDRSFFWYANFFGIYYWYSLVYYALGDWLMTHGDRFLRKKWKLILAIPAGMACLFVTAMARSRVGLATYNHVYYNYSSIFVLGISAALFLLIRDWKPGEKMAKIAASLAECSLGIYILHWLVLELLRQLFPDMMARTVLFPVLALGILVVTWGTVWVCKKIPLLRPLFTLS